MSPLFIILIFIAIIVAADAYAGGPPDENGWG